MPIGEGLDHRAFGEGDIVGQFVCERGRMHDIGREKPCTGGVAQNTSRSDRHCRCRAWTRATTGPGTPGSMQTRSPTLRSSTLAPTSTTVPAASWPSTMGALDHITGRWRHACSSARRCRKRRPYRPEPSRRRVRRELAGQHPAVRAPLAVPAPMHASRPPLPERSAPLGLAKARDCQASALGIDNLHPAVDPAPER